MDALVVQNDEALSLARELAERRGTSVDEAVLTALRASLQSSVGDWLPEPRLPSPDTASMTLQQRARYNSILDLARSVAAKKPGGTSQHNDLYDEFGLPR